MLTLLAIFLDPFVIVLGVVCGLWLRGPWWNLTIAALLIGGVNEFLLAQTQMLPRPWEKLILGTFLAAVATGIWMKVGRVVKKRREEVRARKTVGSA